MARTANILAWVITVFLAAGFLLAGGAKLASSPQMVQEFAQIGFGQWFRYVTGLLEVGGALALFVPRLRFWGALVLACVMVGATAANFAMHMAAAAKLTIVLLILALILAWLRRPARPQANLRASA